MFVDSVMLNSLIQTALNGQRKHTNTLDGSWLSVIEIAEHLGASDDNSLPTHQVGWMSKVNNVEVDEWVRSGGAADKSDKPDTEQ